MQRIVILVVLVLELFSSCSDGKSENLIKRYFTQIQSDHDEWRSTLERFIRDTISSEELKRLFFSDNQTVPFERRDVLLVGRYFNVSDSLLFEHELLLDEKNNLLGPFFSNSDFDKEQLRELLKIENEIIAVLFKIEMEIDAE